MIPARFVPHVVNPITAKTITAPYVATLTNLDGTQETSPGFKTHGGLMIWLGQNRNGRAAVTNVIGKCSFPGEKPGTFQEIAVRFFEEGTAPERDPDLEDMERLRNAP